MGGRLLQGVSLRITGIVQGVGFRPHVYRLATELGLSGQVWNDTAGASVELFGPPEKIEEFVEALTKHPPPLARLDRVERRALPGEGPSGFRIVESRDDAVRTCLVSPDVAVCDDCLREMLDAEDPRYEYPYINCTNCGPRFTIIRDLPYDRPKTTMAAFPMCEMCERQYHDPADRRFHAQPVACPVCGPTVRLGSLDGIVAIREAARLLRGGSVLAIKGIGGYHLACDARNEEAVQVLRQRKGREEKPLAVMAPSLGVAEQNVAPTDAERELLLSTARPIVLIQRSTACNLAPSIAPGNPRIGVMLPYTPLHHLLFREGAPDVLVMTSGNVSEEPIAFTEEQAFERLSGIADAFLTGDRPIHTRCDDSVVHVVDGGPSFLRRSRGYVPLPIELPFSVHGVLAVGGELKNTFAIGRDSSAFVSHHIGDLKNVEEYDAFRLGVEQFEALAEVEPTTLACDMHPLYLSGGYARRRDMPVIEVQHHHAHIASVMAEHGLPNEPVIGVAFDGTGYGPDGTVWGAEFLIANYTDFTRALHFAPIPLPGGDAAIKQNWKSAAAYLAGLMDEDEAVRLLLNQEAAPERDIRTVLRLIRRGTNCIPAASAGRLFDAVASLLGMRQRDSFEGQGAMELEALGTQVAPEGAYMYTKVADSLEMASVVEGVLADLGAGVPRELIAAKFHETLARCIASECFALSEAYGIRTVCLSGGTFQNRLLTERTLNLLRDRGLKPLINRQVPANDGGICLGQIAVAAWRMGLCA
ncbi:MAG: carbamoyltransferase HypF [Fimbriimonadia bacterium]|jgi:hydrogenase maturation protein HypF